MRVMTTQESPSPAPSAAAPTRLLRRRSSGRVIGGVAGGLGDYLNIDPLLVRIGFVGLMVFGGAGLVLYVIAWLLIPVEGADRSALEGIVGRPHVISRTIGWIVVGLVVWFVLHALFTYGGYVSLSDPGPYYGGTDWGLIIAIAVIVVGVLLFRSRGGGSEAGAVAAAVAVAAAAAPVSATPALPVAPRVMRERRPRSPLAWYAIAATLLVIGLLAMVTQAANVEVRPGQFFGVALAVLGIGLLIGAWWGHARILVLLAILLMPLAVVANFMTAPLEGGFADTQFAPANAAELRTEYRLMGGRLVLDLTQLSVTAQPIHIAASVALGQLVVVVPDGASVQIESRVGAGSVYIFDQRDAGTSLEDRYVRQHAHGPTFILDLQSGIGEIQVVSRSFGGY